jgi:hypothetical protein
MSLYTNSDVKFLKDNLKNILEEIQKKKLQVIEPYGKEMREVTDIIMTYVRDNRRKIYGGAAINMLVKEKNPKDAFYKDIDFPDIDFYSPEPLQDIYKICNILFDKGYKSIQGKEAMHGETYSIYVNSHLYCDISYVPWNIYNKIPFKEIKGVYVTGPNFIAIDYLRIITEPLFSGWRLEKGFPRFTLLQKYYPLPHTENKIKLPDVKEPKLLDAINDFIVTKDSLIVIGLYAFNYFLMNSGLLTSKDKQAQKFKLLDFSYFEIISTNFREDTLELIKHLKTVNSESIKVVEHYPFFQFFGHSAYIYSGDNLIAIVYHYNKRCTPYLKLPSYNFKGGKATKSKGDVTIGTFSVVLMYALITVIKARSDNDEVRKQIYHDTVSQLVEMRNFYLKVNKKTIFDKTIFQDFVVECKGEMLDPHREHQLVYEERKKKNKRFYNFKYEPTAESISKQSDITHRFANSSGNPVNNDRNLKLSAYVYEGIDQADEMVEEKIVLDPRAAKNTENDLENDLEGDVDAELEYELERERNK